MSISTRATAPKSRSRQIDVRKGTLARDLRQALIRDLRQGAVAIFPTETVYGIGASAFSPVGIRRIYQLKGRRWNKPLALLLPSLEAAAPLVEDIPAEARRLAKHFWPGPLTMVLRASPLGRLVTGGLDRIGLRVPKHPVVLDILTTLGIPLATTSVNRSGHEPATTYATAHRFGRSVEWHLNGGTCTLKEASSVVDLSSFPFTVIRSGAIPKLELEVALHSAHP